MAPPKKKARSLPEKPKANAGAPQIGDWSHAVTRHEEAVKGFIDDVDTVASANSVDTKDTALSSAAASLVATKSAQRDIFAKLEGITQLRAQKGTELERLKVKLRNMTYEKSHLKAQLEVCSQYPTPELERMCRDEMDDETTPAEEIQKKFLSGSILEPSENNVVMAKLHKELNARGTLERDLEKARSDLAKKKRLAEQEKVFLADVPKKLEMIERSSMALQNFFQNSKTSATLGLIGSDRKKRLDLAKSLPGPLYSLVVQFQAQVDDPGNDDLSLEISRSKQKPDEIAPYPQVVHLSLLIPEIQQQSKESSSKRKRATVEFSFVEEYALITARAFGFQVYSPALLEELFPGDHGTWIRRPDNSVSLPGQPYHWCNFIAGLHCPYPKSDTTGIHHSSKTVIRELRKRVQANATLTQLLGAFEKKKKPVAHASLTGKLHLKSCTSSLSSWAATDDSNANLAFKKTYVAVIKRGSKSLTAHVLLDWPKYPGVRPLWFIGNGKPGWASETTDGPTSSKLDDESNPLHVSALHEIESSVNTMVAVVDNSGVTSMNAGEDWIIAHQLIHLICLWDKYQQGVEGAGAGGNKKGRARV